MAAKKGDVHVDFRIPGDMLTEIREESARTGNSINKILLERVERGTGGTGVPRDHPAEKIRVLQAIIDDIKRAADADAPYRL